MPVSDFRNNLTFSAKIICEIYSVCMAQFCLAIVQVIGNINWQRKFQMN
jgi:hypothetical protein